MAKVQLLTSSIAAQAPAVLADAGAWNHMSGWGWGMAISGWLFMAPIIALVVWLIWSTTHQRPPSSGHDGRALRLLGERYAQGEIDRDQYLERKTDLER